MAQLNIPLLTLVLTMGSIIGAPLPSNGIASAVSLEKNANPQIPPQTSENTARLYPLNMSFFPLVRTLIKGMPISAKRLNEIGIPMRQSGSYSDRVDYAGACEPIVLNDGVILEKFDLRVANSEHTKGPFFSFDIQRGNISRQTVERELGEFRLDSVPRGNSWAEKFVYVKKVGEYSVFAGYRLSRDLKEGNLTGISFDAAIQIKQ
ncbi:MAG: hypothetical protein LBH14_07530 [Desulfobulbaceae bacterium]|nr:hypothetical protein [Desulfobulbaceae bacterium]